MNLIITNAGLAALVNAEQTGMNQIVISHIAFGSGQYTASAAQVSLQSEITRLDVFSGGIEPATNSIHVAVQDSSNDYYSAYEVGVFLSDGTLFAVYSQAEKILEKVYSSAVRFELGVAITGASVENISFGDVEFSYPYGNETRPGIWQAATNAETSSGTSTNRVVTPSTLNYVLNARLAVNASESVAGKVQLATQAETNAGTNLTKAITPKKLADYLPQYSGTLSKSKVIAAGGSAQRALENRFADNISPLDFGAIGNGTTSDVNAFNSFESVVTGRDVNLAGRTYVVTSKPIKNNYYNGSFKIGTTIIKSVYDFHKFGGTSECNINVRRDFSEFSRGGGLLIASNLTKSGTNSGNIVQSTVADTVNRYFYTLHVTTEDKAVINRVPINIQGGASPCESNAYSLPSEIIGHQGLGIEYTSTGAVKLWGSCVYQGVSSSSIASKGTKAVRFNPPTSNGTNVDTGIEIFNLFPEVANSSQATTVCVSYSGKYLIAKYNLSGNLFRVRIFKLSDFTAAGDYQNRFIHEFDATFTLDGTSGLERALQGIACDDRFIYFLAAGVGLSIKHSLYVYDMYGNKVDEFRNLKLGQEIGRSANTTYYEPQSLFFMELNGSTKLCLQIGTGDTTGNRLTHVIALNAKQNYYFGTGSSSGSYHGIAIDDAGRFTNTEGRGNISLYPSGLSQETTARVGSCQKALVRFSGDTSGTNFVLYKSRGTSIGQSVAVRPSDVIGGIHFMADNGNINYDGSTQGARAAYIEALVHSSSTIPASGNTNIGIKGFLRFITCEDSSSRNGQGLEILTTEVRPTADNALNLGTSTRRWSNVYSASGTLQTSDENYKEDIEEIQENIFNAWKNVHFVTFKFKEAVKEKGDKARKHIGLIAQRIIKAFEDEGLNAFDYGLICSDKDENGNEILFLRYDECLALECAYQRYTLEKILYKLNCEE